MEKEYKDMSEDEKFQHKVQAALKLSQDLPQSTFAAVPDEDIVTIEISGKFGRVLNRVLEYLYQSEDETQVLKAADLVKKDLEGVKPEDLTLHTISLWAMSNLLADFSVQAGLQNKTKTYDRDTIMTHIFSGVTSDKPLVPLTQEELNERIAEERTKMKNEIKKELSEELSEEEEIRRRELRRQHRNNQKEQDIVDDSEDNTSNTPED
jgi:LPS O-antigen subunit length determinant protein (WzzB/FepE family)